MIDQIIDQIIKNIAEIRKNGYDLIHIEMSETIWHNLTRDFLVQTSDHIVGNIRFRGIDVVKDKYFPEDYLCFSVWSCST